MKRIFGVIIGLAVALSALQAQNAVAVSDVNLKQGETAVISVDLTNETVFTSFQMDLKLPEGFVVATTINEDEEEVLDISLTDARKKSTHSLSYNTLSDGTIRIASFSSTNASYKGTSGEIVQIRIMATDAAVVGNNTAELYNILFTTAEPIGYDLEDVVFQIVYSKEEELPNCNVEVHAGKYGRCILNGRVVDPEGTYALPSGIKHGGAIKLYFVPFDGYTANEMKRNGEIVVIGNNVYEEIVAEDVTFTDINYQKVVDTLVVTEIVVDTFVVTETVVVEKVDTIIITEIEELPVPVITCDAGVVAITCEQADVTILYAINGDPIEGHVYVAPFEVKEDAVVSAVAVRSSEVATLPVIVNGVAHSQMRVVSRRYYTENGIEISMPSKGVTVVAVEYEDGSQRVYKMLRN